MMNLTFGEQVKIILGRKGMTIKQLAELVEAYTGKPMSRQNMTQRLGRDNFQEQDMRLIAEILGCQFRLSIMEADAVAECVEMTAKNMEFVAEAEIVEEDPLVRDITMGELIEIAEEADAVETDTAEADVTAEMTDDMTENVAEDVAEAVVTEGEEASNEAKQPEESEERKLLKKGIGGYFQKHEGKSGEKKEENNVEIGDINPYTRKEYKTNSVRIHPKKIGYVQVYDQEQHKWTDMTEWAFLAYQERKKVLLGKDYEPPIYLD